MLHNSYVLAIKDETRAATLPWRVNLAENEEYLALPPVNAIELAVVPLIENRRDGRITHSIC